VVRDAQCGVLIVISGPIASGKSSIARGVARELEREGLTTAVVDLDLVYHMQGHTSADQQGDASRWQAARRAAAAIAESFLKDGIATVLVEGSFQDVAAREVLAAVLQSTSEAHFVTLRVSYQEALRRAKADPTRGASRDAAFLRRYYDDRRSALENVPPGDLVIDTERLTEQEAVATIVRAVM
jgi:cytidylate kinase